MVDSDDLDDWELLPFPDVPAPCFNPNSPDSESDGHTANINAGYFALDSGDQYATSAAAYHGDADGSRSDGRSSSPDGEKGETFGGEDAGLDVGLSVIDAGHRNSDVDADFNEGSETGKEEPYELEPVDPVRMESMDDGTEESEVGSEAIDAGSDNTDKDAALKQAATSGENEEIGGGDQLRSVVGESASTEDGDGSSVGSSQGVDASENVSRCEGEKTVEVWAKLPLKLLKLCVSRVRPVWGITIAAGIVGMLMLGKRLYKMIHKSRSIPLKVMDDKKSSQLIVRTARLNEAFSVVRRVPIIRLPPPAGGLTQWPAAGSIRALDW